MKTVIKSSGEVQEFDYKKIQKNLELTFKMLKTPEGQAQQFTRQTLLTFAKWQKDKPEITTEDIRRQIGKILKNIYPDAAYIFKNFKSII